LLGISIQGCTYNTRYRICPIYLILEWNLLSLRLRIVSMSYSFFSVYVLFASVLVIVQSRVGVAMPVLIFPLFSIIFLRLFVILLVYVSIVRILKASVCRDRYRPPLSVWLYRLFTFPNFLYCVSLYSHYVCGTVPTVYIRSGNHLLQLSWFTFPLSGFIRSLHHCPFGF
jgi:hypothetical protein